MKKLKNGHHFININHIENFQIINPPKVWVSSFLSVNKNRISALAIMKKIEKWPPFHKYRSYGKKFQVTDSLKFCLWFSECQWKWTIGINSLWKIEKWPPFHKYQLYGKIPNYWPLPKVWVSSFLSVNKNRISELAIMKKLKNDHHFINIDHTEKFQITDSLKFCLWFSECQWKWTIGINSLWKNWKMATIS